MCVCVCVIVNKTLAIFFILASCVPYMKLFEFVRLNPIFRIKLFIFFSKFKNIFYYLLCHIC